MKPRIDVYLDRVVIEGQTVMKPKMFTVSEWEKHWSKIVNMLRWED